MSGEAQINIKECRKMVSFKRTGQNTYSLGNLSTGKLLCLAQLTGESIENPLAHDIFHIIASCFYEHDKQNYDYIQKYHKT